MSNLLDNMTQDERDACLGVSEGRKHPSSASDNSSKTLVTSHSDGQETKIYCCGSGLIGFQFKGDVKSSHWDVVVAVWNSKEKGGDHV